MLDTVYKTEKKQLQFRYICNDLFTINIILKHFYVNSDRPKNVYKPAIL